MIRLPYANALWPQHRVLVGQSWNGGNTQWQALPMQAAGVRVNGFEVLSYQRVCFPATAMATLRYRWGRLNGALVAPPPGVVGGLWDPTTMSVSVPDLRGLEIRIDVSDPGLAGTPITPPLWQTVYWGQVEYQEVTGYPSSILPYGQVIYHLSDAFFRTKRWALNRHGAFLTGSANTPTMMVNCWGHPGYNAVDGMGHLTGNDASGTQYDPTQNNGQSYNPASNIPSPGDGLYKVDYLTWPGAGYPFTDLQVVNHAVGVVRPFNEPIFKIVGAGSSGKATAGLDVVTGSPWQVRDGDTVYDLVMRICDRRRGRGLVYLDWAPNLSAGIASLVPQLTVAPQFLDDVTYINPQTLIGQQGQMFTSAPSSITIAGANTCGTTVTVDLSGDHRAVPSAFRLGDRDQHRLDYLETVSECLEVLVTLSRYDSTGGTAGGTGVALSLENRWGPLLESAFKALAVNKRTDEAYRPYAQLYGLPRQWIGMISDHNNGSSVAAHRCDYRCGDDGSVIAPGANSAQVTWPNDTSPMMIEVLPDLPLLEGYDYSGAVPARKDGLLETGVPPRRPPLILMRVGTNLYFTGEMVTRPMTIHVSRDGITMMAPEDQSSLAAYRECSDTSAAGTSANLNALYDNWQIGCTVALRLPHRVRFASYGIDPKTGLQVSPIAAHRRRTITHRGCHLWLADAAAIWDIDASQNNGQGLPAKRNALQSSPGSPGVLRDDRGPLAAMHHIASKWYLSERRTATWALRCNGFLGSFPTINADSSAGAPVTYPAIGQTITTLTGGGQLNTVNTPITSVTYDAEHRVTTWQTDWGELDFQR
jgi:hypothetical protein